MILGKAEVFGPPMAVEPRAAPVRKVDHTITDPQQADPSGSEVLCGHRLPVRGPE